MLSSTYLIRRLLLAMVTILLVAFVAFTLVRLMPGDALLAKVVEGGTVSPERLGKLRAELGLDKPIATQFVLWIGAIVLHGDFGNSFATSKPTVSNFIEALPVTLELGLIAISFAVTLAIPVGVISALKQDSWIDYALRTFAIIGISVPTFFVGILLIVYPSILFRWEWPHGAAARFGDPLVNLKAFVVPGMILGLGYSASIMRFLRTAVLDTLRQDYVRTARAKGLPESTVISRHVLRNSMLPVITLIGAHLGFLLGGSVIVERLFGLPGIGQLTFASVGTADYPQLQTNLLIVASAIVMMNLVTDLTYSFIDPRVTLG